MGNRQIALHFSKVERRKGSMQNLIKPGRKILASFAQAKLGNGKHATFASKETNA